MKRRITEKDFTRIVKRVINEGVIQTGPLTSFEDGIYTLTKVVDPTQGSNTEGASNKGLFFVKTGNEVSIVKGQVTKEGKPYGGGALYKG